MQCPKCQFKNPVGAKFCNECGNRMVIACPSCNQINPPGSKFCNECGFMLAGQEDSLCNPLVKPSRDTATAQHTIAEGISDTTDSERKFVTVLFSDMAGYTEISEMLDPEEVKEITGEIFSEISKIVEKYDGFIEKYIGDAILAVFGAVQSFEDSALRAIKAAREIHTFVDAISPRHEKRIARPLKMHTGINTGLVVTGQINVEKGTHGLVGDTINTASRLMSISKAGEIIVDHDSFTQTEGYFEFDALDPVKVKGKDELIKVYRVGNMLQEPKKLHRLHGLRAELIGRSIEMHVLEDAAERLAQNQGSMISVCGSAGTGKSRLIYEFKRSLDLTKFQWLDGNAYAYTENIPYYPLIDLMTRAFQIKENDSHKIINQKVETALKGLIAEDSKASHYLGSLFFIDDEETRQVSPEFWKEQLFTSIRSVLESLAKSGPTIVCIEDMHWTDPSFLELFRKLVTSISVPILFICIHRPTITLFSDIEMQSLKIPVKELKIDDLSPSETNTMICSLLQTKRVPKALMGFGDSVLGGNPFYLEEYINSLVESQTLSKISGEWKAIKPIDDLGISSNIQKIIAGRIDRLDRRSKRILQEASVIGRVFLYDILFRVSKIKEDLEKNLVVLERSDLIRPKSVQPPLEYIFKHALTQDIVYNGLVIKERQVIHERIGAALEVLFNHRLSEFYEILAYHFSRSNAYEKAIEYLVKSGEKSLRRHSLDEANDYFSEAIQICNSMPDKNRKNLNPIKIICKWAFVHDHMGKFGDLLTILHDALKEVESAEINSDVGNFYAWLGFAYFRNDSYDQAETYLDQALSIGRSINDDRIVAYALTWLVWVYGMRGKLAKALEISNEAAPIVHAHSEDRELFRHHVLGTGLAHFFCGNCKEAKARGKMLLEYGKEHSDYRSLCMGFQVAGMERIIVGDYDGAIEKLNESISVLSERAFNHSAKILLGMAYVASGRIEEAETVVQEVLSFSDTIKLDYFQTPAQTLWSVILLSKGELSDGIKLVQQIIEKHTERGSLYSLSTQLLLVGRFYYYLASGEKKSGSKILKNIPFLIGNYFVAEQKARNYLSRSIELSKKIGAQNILGQANYFMGLCHRLKKRRSDAEEHIKESIRIFKETDANKFLEKARNSLNRISSELNQ